MDSPMYEVTTAPAGNEARSNGTTCSVCSKSFKTRFALTQHYKIHYIEKVYACPSCNKKFATKGCLEIHELSHSSDICKLCGNSFAHSSGSRNPKNLCDTCSGYSSPPEMASEDQQSSYTEEDSFVSQPRSSTRQDRRVYVSERQKLKLVQFMEDHPSLARNQLNQHCNPKGRKHLWEELRVILNNEGYGRVKTVAQWKKCWNDLKSSVRERAAKLKADRGLSAQCPPLSDIDERIFTLTKISAARDQVRRRQPSRREGLRGYSVRVELPRIQAPEDCSFSNEDEVSVSSSELDSKLVENGSPTLDNHGSTSPDCEKKPPKQAEFDVIDNENGIKDKRIPFLMTELKETKAAMISLAEINKETLSAFKSITAAQEQLVALQTTRNEEQRQFENKLLLMVEGLLTHIRNKK